MCTCYFPFCRKLLESNSELTAACIDTWSNLNCNVELSAQVSYILLVLIVVYYT